MNQNDLIKNFGVMTFPYASRWPDLASKLEVLYRDKLANIPWLPTEWRAVVLDSIHGKGGNIVAIVPSTANYPGGTGAYFLDTPQKKAWWDQLAAATSKAITDFAAGKAAEGKQELDDAIANADFWNEGAGDKMIQWARILASPVTGLKAGFDNPYKTTAIAVGVGGAILGLWLFLRSRSNKRR